MEANQNAGNSVPLLSVRGIYKSFGLNAVLKGIDLDVMPGEVLALIGGNGAGKSTLMKIIMGIYSHDKGHMSMNGGAVALNRPSDALARGIYMVPQEPLLFPNMNVEENITIGFDRGKAELHRELVDTMAEIGWIWAARPAACPSPSSSWWRSSGVFCAMPDCSFWMSPPPRSPLTR